MSQLFEECAKSKTSTETLIVTPEAPKFHVVLDIDCTLATGFGNQLEMLLEEFPDLKYWLHNNLHLHIFYPYFLHPGAIELIQWLFKNPNVKVSFFSNGDETRNRLFVNSLLAHSLDHHHSIRDKVNVYSKEKPDVGNHGELASISPLSNITKDLRRIEPTNLDNILLVDDNSAVILPEQKTNLLLTSGASIEDFMRVLSELKKDPWLSNYEVRSHLLNMNHIFFIVGILKEAFSMDKNCLAKNVHSLTSPFYNNDDNLDKFLYYLNGLAVLREINPNLNFYQDKLLTEYVESRKSTLSNKA